MARDGETILFRADAGSRIGTGHVMRCLALGQAWHDEAGSAVFALAADVPDLAARLTLDGMIVERVHAEPGSDTDAQATAALAKHYQARWVVVDGYYFFSRFQKLLKDEGLRVLAVDDFGHADHYWADVVLNQNLHAEERFYQKREAYTRLLLGTAYVLLRREFIEWHRWKRAIPATAHKLLVTLGGSDPDNTTRSVIQALHGETDLHVRIVLGAANLHADSLETIASSSGPKIEFLRSVPDMPSLMAWADLAIAAGGSTLWELAFFGLPSIILTLAENQLHSAHLLLRQGKIAACAAGPGVSPSWIASEVRKLRVAANQRSELSMRISSLVDGLGASRIMAALN